MQKLVSGLDLACLILRRERALSQYRAYKIEPFKLTRHQKKAFNRLGFFSYRAGSDDPVLVRDEKKVLTRLLKQERFTITQHMWIRGSCWTYVLAAEDEHRMREPEFSWCVFLDQLPKHAVSQQKLGVVLDCARETVNRRLTSRAVRRLVASRKTYLFSHKKPVTRVWFPLPKGGYLRPWNNEYSSKVEYTKIHRTYFFEKKALWQVFRDENNPRSVPHGRRIHQSPPSSAPTLWKVMVRRTISRTNKVRSRMPASQRNRDVRFFDSSDLHKLTYRTMTQVQVFGAEEKKCETTFIGITPCRLEKDEHRFATQPFRVMKGSARQIWGRERVRQAREGKRGAQNPGPRRAGFFQ